MQPKAALETRQYYEEFPFIEGGEPRIQWWQEYLRPFLPDELIQDRMIADIGSSIGEITRGLLNRGARMKCVDLTLKALRRNAEINPEAERFHGSAIDLPFADESFDHTMSIGVLMITPDCRKGFSEVARITRPGGRVVLFVYNYWCYLNLAYQLFAPIRKRVPLQSVPSGMVRMMQPFVKGHLGIKLEEPQLRRLLGDKLWTPHATFHSMKEMERWGEEEGLKLLSWKRFYHSYANVMAFQKEGESSDEPRQSVVLRCVKCDNQPIHRSDEGYRCGSCGELYSEEENVFRCLA